VNDLPLVVGGTVRTPFDLASITPDAKNLGGGLFQSRPREIDRAIRRDARFQIRGRLRFAVRKKSAFCIARPRGLGNRQLADFEHQHLR